MTLADLLKALPATGLHDPAFPRRLPDAAATSVPLRQGWVGDTLWDQEGAGTLLDHRAELPAAQPVA